MPSPEPAHADTVRSARHVEHGGLSLDSIVRVIRRRLWLLTGGIALTLLAAILILFQLTPRYTAETTVMIYPREEKVIDIDAVVSRLTADDQAIQSEIRVIRSAGVARRVVQTLGLTRDDEFNPHIRGSLLDRLLAWAGSTWLRAAFGDISAGVDAEVDEAREEGATVEAFLKRLEVEAQGRSRVISIAFTSEDRHLAARAANAIARAYLDFQVETKIEARRLASDWLGERLRAIQADVQQSEEAVERFRAGIIESERRDERVLAQQLGETNSQLTQARGDYEKARARLAQITQMVDEFGREAVFDIVDPQLTLWMNEQFVRLRQTEAELNARHGPDHPVVVELRDEIASLRSRTADHLIAVARYEVGAAELKIHAFEAVLEQLLGDSVDIGQAHVQLRALEREAAANVALFEAFLDRSKETAQEGFERPDALVVSAATAPIKPSHPDTLRFMALALAGSLVVGFGLVFVAEELETGYRSSELLHEETGLRCLSAIPFVDGGRGRREPASAVLEDPAGPHAESLRTLHTSLVMLPRRHEGGQAIQFTSAVANEGKSSTVAALTRVIALSGARVVAVDCDLRQNTLHRAFGIERGPGVTDFLAGDFDLRAVLRPDPRSGASIVTSGHAADDPLRLLRTPRLGELLDSLRQHFDFVLVDSPPVLAMADARVLTGSVDHCVLVVRWVETRRDAVRACQRQLEESHAPLCGFVMSHVRGHAIMGYGYPYRYYG